MHEAMHDGIAYGRTDVRTYGHDVITKFSELHGLLPFSLTNGAPQAAFGRWSSAIISTKLHDKKINYNLIVKLQDFSKYQYFIAAGL